MDFDHSLDKITPDLSTILTIGGTGALSLPSGTTAQRPGGAAAGALRWNTDTTAIAELYNGTSWLPFGPFTAGTGISITSGVIANTGVTSITGSTNLTASGSTGAITLSLPTTMSGFTSISSTGFTGALTGAASSNVLKAGDTMTGALVIAPASGAANLTVGTAASGNASSLFFKTNSLSRWQLVSTNTAESGSNVGSDFAISRYDDSGTFVDSPVAITRASGLVTLKDSLNVTGNLAVSMTVGSPLMSVAAPSAQNASVELAGNGNTVGTTGFLIRQDSSSIAQIVQRAAADLRIQVNGSERLRITSAGALGLSGANYGTTGQAVTSQGSSSPPVWADTVNQVVAGQGINITYTGGTSGTGNVTVKLATMVTVGTTAPSSPVAGDIWIDTN